MPVFPDAKPKSSIGQVFRDQMEALADYAAQAADKPAQTDWYRPKGLKDSLTEIDKLHASFSRDEQEADFTSTVKDLDNRGTVGDLSIVQLQGDMLHCLERAFRARHHTSCRTRIHPLARLRGHGMPAGVIREGMEGYIVNLDLMNKGEDT